MGKKIYHYTTVGSLISILSTGIFRFYSLQEGNDSRELRYLAKALRSFARRKAGDRLIPPQSSFALAEFKRALEQYSCYGICLTDKGDDAELWLRYAPDDGISIKFDYEKVCEYFKKITVKLDYGDEDKNYSIAQCERVIYCVPSSNVLDSIFEYMFGDQPISIETISNGSVGPVLFKLSCLVKAKKWESESETRVCFLNFSNAGLNSALPPVSFGSTAEICDLKVDYICGKFRHYYEIPFDPNLIEGIVVGPTCSVQDTNRLKRILHIAYSAGCRSQVSDLQSSSAVPGFFTNDDISLSRLCKGVIR